MNKSDSLEKFISEYISQYPRDDKKAISYSDWLKQNDRGTRKIKEETDLAINALAKAKSAGGSLGESLGSLGLSDSGYAFFLRRQRVGEKTGILNEKKQELLDAESLSKESFRSYLSKNRTTTERVFRSTVNTIRSSGIISYDTAYLYAISAGLPSADAKAAASAATEINRSELKESITKTILSKSLTAAAAKEYALSLGLSREEAEAFGKYAEKINSSASVDNIAGYLEELKNSNPTTK